MCVPLGHLQPARPTAPSSDVEPVGHRSHVLPVELKKWFSMHRQDARPAPPVGLTEFDGQATQVPASLKRWSGHLQSAILVEPG